MLNRIEILGFEIIAGTPPTVVTNYRINRIPTTIPDSNPASSAAIQNVITPNPDGITPTSFETSVLAETANAVGANSALFDVNDPVFGNAAPAGAPGSGG